MLGDTYVDSQRADASPALEEFQEYITTQAWGVWARGGPLSTRDRSLNPEVPGRTACSRERHDPANSGTYGRPDMSHNHRMTRG